MAANWTPASWRDHDGRQMPEYTDAAALAAAETQLGSYPPLVFAGEARALKADLAKVAPAKPSCSRAATAPNPSPSSIRTTFATRSACCCRWRWC